MAAALSRLFQEKDRLLRQPQPHFESD